MPPTRVRLAIVCQNCERIYLLAHPARAKWIRFESDINPEWPYRLVCECGSRRLFGRSHILAYAVSENACPRGYAERGNYDMLPSPKVQGRVEHKSGRTV